MGTDVLFLKQIQLKNCDQWGLLFNHLLL